MSDVLGMVFVGRLRSVILRRAVVADSLWPPLCKDANVFLVGPDMDSYREDIQLVAAAWPQGRTRNQSVHLTGMRKILVDQLTG